MQPNNGKEIEQAIKSSLQDLLHNAHGPFHGLPQRVNAQRKKDRHLIVRRNQDITTK